MNFSIKTSVPVQSEMTANLRHYLHAPILNIIKVRDKYRMSKLNSKKKPLIFNFGKLFNIGVYDTGPVDMKNDLQAFLKSLTFFSTNQPTNHYTLCIKI